ncbi:MAG: ArsR/SmtB family transcription factor [Brevefilum sp.]
MHVLIYTGHLMNNKDYQSQATIFQVLSHPVRLQILDALREQPCCVCHLQALTQRPQAYVSQQLRVLREAGMVSDEKDGQNVYYWICDAAVDDLLGKILGSAGLRATFTDCKCPRCIDDDG